MFQGSSSINMDAKGRIAIPAEYRELLASECGGKLVVTAHNYERCALIYPESEWLKILPKIEALPDSQRVARNAKRLLIGNARQIDMDSNGRMLIPQTIRDYSKMDKKLMLAGMGKKFELWDEGAWYATLEEDAGDEIPDAMMNLSL